MKRYLLCLLSVIMLLCLLLSFPALAESVHLTLDTQSGFFTEPFTLTVTCDHPDARVYYTLDGSIPDENSLPFPADGLFMDRTGKMEDTLRHVPGTSLDTDAYTLPDEDFPSAHALRAVAVLPDGTRSNVVSGTYFVGYYRNRLYGDLPVISLIMEPSALFDYETGIYILGKTFAEWEAEQTESFEAWQAVGNFSNRGRDWEREVTVDFMMSEQEYFQQDMGVRIKGGTSRTAPQKSLRLIAREDYGEKNVKYPLFTDNYREADGDLVEKYKSVTLRNGGNDRGVALIRDPYITALAEGMHFETAANRPVIGFINGEYWGIYTLHEEYSDNFIGYHYDIDNKNVITVKNGKVEDGEEEDYALYEEMYDFIAYGDMTEEADYLAACDMLDMDSFADYLALTFYICNDDSIFEGNNWQLWRVREPEEGAESPADGKWRVMLFDSDHAAGVYQNGANFMERNIDGKIFDEAEDGHPARLAQSLIWNDDFMEKLIVAMLDVRNLHFEENRAAKLLQSMTSQYQPYAPDTFRRFGPMWGPWWDAKGAYGNNLRDVGTFFTGRYDGFPAVMQDAFSLDDPITVTLAAEGAGMIRVNGRSVTVTKPLELVYFPGLPLTLEAIAQDGSAFTLWQIPESDTVIEDLCAPSFTLYPEESMTLTAVFE